MTHSSVFVDGFDAQAKRACLTIVKETYDKFDGWGWAMGWLFDIAGEISDRPGIVVPSELGYQMGAGGAHVSEDNEAALSELGDDALLWAARVLNRYADMMHKAGESY